jgi:hypothetical protein
MAPATLAHVMRREDETNGGAYEEAMAAELERVGLIEVRVVGGRVRYRTTPEGERLHRMLAMADRDDAEAVLAALLDAGPPADHPH